MTACSKILEKRKRGRPRKDTKRFSLFSFCFYFFDFFFKRLNAEPDEKVFETNFKPIRKTSKICEETIVEEENLYLPPRKQKGDLM